MEELRQFLTRRDETRLGLERAGYGEIVLSPCDGPRDMVQRMNAGEFDLVFATAIVYAQLPGPAYEPVLQFKRSGGGRADGDFQMPGREGVFRQGIIFVGPGSALFRQPGEPTREQLRKLLERVPLAVPTADSAAGYLAPRYKMEHDLGLRQGPAPLFCGSDSEVVKHVVSGLAEVGACRRDALAELLPSGGGEGKFYKQLALTDPMPTDPILLRRSLMPASNGLGVTLKRALREFFTRSDMTVDNTSPRSFEMIISYLAELKTPRPASAEPAMPAAPKPAAAAAAATSSSTPRPALAATPTPTPTPTSTPKPAPTATPAPAPAPVATPALPPAATSTPAATATPAPAPSPAPRATPALPQPARAPTSSTLAASPATTATLATPTPTPRPKRRRRSPRPNPNMPELSPALPGLIPTPKPAEAPQSTNPGAQQPQATGMRPALPPPRPQATRPQAKPQPAPSPVPRERNPIRSWWRKATGNETQQKTSMSINEASPDNRAAKNAGAIHGLRSEFHSGGSAA